MTERQRAIDAGLLIGTCEWCRDDIWSDRSFDAVRYGALIWHRDCAEQCYQALQVALEL